MTLAVGVLALVGAGCGDDPAAAPAVDLSGKSFDIETSKADVEVDALDNQFTPPYIEVSRGTTVGFTNKGRNQHNVLPAEQGAFSPIETAMFAPDASAELTFDQVGDYPYYCSLHGTTTKGMVGAIRVVE
jgi:plastocyanin